MQINGHVYNHRRELCNFALVDARSIRNKNKKLVMMALSQTVAWVIAFLIILQSTATCSSKTSPRKEGNNLSQDTLHRFY